MNKAFILTDNYRSLFWASRKLFLNRNEWNLNLIAGDVSLIDVVTWKFPFIEKHRELSKVI